MLICGWEIFMSFMIIGLLWNLVFIVVYLVLGKVYWNWVIIDMWVVWFSVLIVDVGNWSIFLIKLK